MLNYNAQRDDHIVELERMVDHQMTMITSLCGRLGTLEDALRRVQEEPSRPPTPEVINLTLDEEEDEYVTSSSVIDLSDTDVEDDVVDLLGGPLEVQVEREDTRVPETPPPQEVMEALRSTPIREEDNREANRAVDLLVRAGLALPEYEEAPVYTKFE